MSSKSGTTIAQGLKYNLHNQLVLIEKEMIDSHLKSAFRFSGSSVRPAYPGFIVINIPTVGTSVISSPIKSNLNFLFLIASSTDFTCTATTDSTSTDIRLNSSKQPHAPV